MKIFRSIMALIIALSLFACGDSTTLREGAWSNAAMLVQDARFPRIGVDGKGNMIAVYPLPDGLYSICFNANSGWGTPRKIVDKPNQNEFFNNLHLAVNDRGDAIAAWVHYKQANSYIQTVRYSSDTGWGDPQLVSPDTFPSLDFDVTLDSNSNAVIVWTGYFNPNILASHSSQTSGWDTPQIIGTNEWAPWAPQFLRVALDNSGNAFALWVEGQYTNNIYVNRFTARAGWGTPRQIATNEGAAAWTNIAFDSNGNAMALWGQNDSSTRYHSFACRYVQGNVWGSVERIDSNPLDSIDQFLAVDTSGNGGFYAIWTQTTGTAATNIYSNHFDPESGWGTPQLVNSRGIARYPKVATDAAGNVFAAWSEYDLDDAFAADAKVYANRLITGTRWGTPQQLKNALGGADVPELAVDPRGYASVIWTQDVGYTLPGSLKYGIFASRFQ